MAFLQPGVQLKSVMAYLLCHVTVNGLYLPFGDTSGDSSITTWHGSSGPFGVDPPFVFYQDSYNETWVNVDGLISFTQGLRTFDIQDPFINIDFEALCVFCASLSPQGDNKVWYRLSTNAADLQAIQDMARQFQDFGATFSPAWVLVVTWDDIGRVFEPDPGNTLQVSIATDGQSSLVLFDYEHIGWVHQSPTNPTIRAKAGFNKGDRKSYYLLPESYTENMTLLNSTSNIDTPGLFLYRVDQATIPEAPTKLSPTTSPPATTAVSSRKRESDDSIAYGVGFGVPGALLLVAIVVCVAVKAGSSKKPRAVHSSNGSKRKPPPYTYEDRHIPVRIPKPDYP